MAVPDLKYTICFCIHETDVLMILRSRAPHINRWNGLGGKIEPGETALSSVIREVREEAGIDLESSTEVTFRGIVTWNLYPGNAQEQGMFVFVARLLQEDARSRPLLSCGEGTLDWMLIERVCDKSNIKNADNLPYCLREIIEGTEILQVRCIYDDQRLYDVTVDYLDPTFASTVGIR